MLSPYLFNFYAEYIMRNTGLEEAQAGIKIAGRKAMTNLDIILKSRDTTLPTKVHIVRAMIFPIVMY